MKFFRKKMSKLPLEVGVVVLVTLSALQNSLLDENVGHEALIFTNVIMLMGVLLGLFGSSLAVFIVNFIVTPFTFYVLFFQPVIMPVPLKLFYCLGILVYSVIAFNISQSVLLRSDLVSGSSDIMRYLKNINPITGFRNEASFHMKYRQYIKSMNDRQLEDTRHLGLVMFQIDFYEQYVYQDKAAARDIFTEIAETLIYSRYPEELFFHLDNGAFVVMTPLNQSEEQVAFWQEMNNTTKTQMEQIPFRAHSTTHDLTIKMGELLILPTEIVDGKQALSLLFRRSEADLSAEYIV